MISDYELIFHNHDSLQRSESIWADRPAPAALVDAAAKVSQNFLADFITENTQKKVALTISPPPPPLNICLVTTTH